MLLGRAEPSAYMCRFRRHNPIMNSEGAPFRRVCPTAAVRLVISLSPSVSAASFRSPTESLIRKYLQQQQRPSMRP